jgi:omega-6 fatty acid desaturase (delta-12 desaturase)
MRSSKELILSSKAFTKEDRFKSWSETVITIVLLTVSLCITFLALPIAVRLIFSVMTALLYVRLFVIYHDYQHHAILQKSNFASLLMKAVGLYLLSPQNVWKRSHDHHHNHNSKLTSNGIGSYPTVSKHTYLSMSKLEKNVYLINRHPLTVFLGYFTLFIYWLNIKSFMQSPKKHLDSLGSLVFHVVAGYLVWLQFGAITFIISWFSPFLLAFAIGSYLFYSQHNFPGAEFRENQDWQYDKAALNSTSLMKMNPFLQWMTGNIGLHHVHHLNSRIPFYRLKEAMDNIPELQHVTTTSWKPTDMYRCLRLKLWDADKGKMIRLDEL